MYARFGHNASMQTWQTGISAIVYQPPLLPCTKTRGYEPIGIDLFFHLLIGDGINEVGEVGAQHVLGDKPKLQSFVVAFFPVEEDGINVFNKVYSDVRGDGANILF